MNINKYTEKAQEALVSAQQLAESRNHSQVDVEHLLLALLEQPEGVVPRLLEKLGAAPAALRQGLTAELDRLPHIFGGSQVSTTYPSLARAWAAYQYISSSACTDPSVITIPGRRAGPATVAQTWPEIVAPSRAVNSTGRTRP